MPNRFQRQYPQQLIQQLSGILGEYNPTYEYLHERKALRVGIGEQYFDIAQGPETDFGPSFEILTRGNYRYSIGASIIGTPGKEKGDRPQLELRSPLSTLNAALQQSISYNLPLSSVLSSKDFSESAVGKSVGATLMYGPSHPERTRQEFASRVTIGATGGLFMNDVVAEIQRKARGGIGPWSHMQQYYPHTEEDNIMRMVRQPYTSGSQYLSLRGDPGKDIKGRNVVFDYRENVGLYGMQGGRVQPMQAAPLSQV
ncbi:MAG: hypothetical protein ACWGQW_19680, partial [bacterium]